jgi:hypothetical protein
MNSLFKTHYLPPHKKIKEKSSAMAELFSYNHIIRFRNLKGLPGRAALQDTQSKTPLQATGYQTCSAAEQRGI